MSDLGINIKEANIRGTEENKKARGTFHLEVKNEQEARQAIEALKKIPGILEVHRR
jgi:(p)ppGpp synthase/HD superfamily hydrolase